MTQCRLKKVHCVFNVYFDDFYNLVACARVTPLPESPWLSLVLWHGDQLTSDSLRLRRSHPVDARAPLRDLEGVGCCDQGGV